MGSNRFFDEKKSQSDFPLHRDCDAVTLCDDDEAPTILYKPGIVAQAKILIADDTETNYKILKMQLVRLFGDSNIEVHIAVNGKLAVAACKTLIKQSRSNYDAIIMDYSMPEMDGLAATRSIHKYEQEKNLDEKHKAYIIGYTTEADEKLRNEFMLETNCKTSLLGKPCSTEKLESILKTAPKFKDRVFQKPLQRSKSSPPGKLPLTRRLDTPIPKQPRSLSTRFAITVKEEGSLEPAMIGKLFVPTPLKPSSKISDKALCESISKLKLGNGR